LSAGNDRVLNADASTYVAAVVTTLLMIGYVFTRPELLGE
jgi:hypothetical protein